MPSPAWLNQVFAAASAANGDVVRRSKQTVNKFSSMAILEAEVRRRGFHMIETGSQVIVICNAGRVQIVV